MDSRTRPAHAALVPVPHEGLGVFIELTSQGLGLPFPFPMRG